MERMPRRWELALIGVTAAVMAAALTDAKADTHNAKAPVAQVATTAAALSTGEVRQIDKSAGKITIKHGPIANLEMPPMTMVFRVKDAAMLDRFKAGDKIAFVAEKVDGALMVTRAEAGK